MFISLPGLTLALDEVDQFEDCDEDSGKTRFEAFIKCEPAWIQDLRDGASGCTALGRYGLCNSMPRRPLANNAVRNMANC